MCDEWMPVVRIPMSIEAFHQLPRHPAYKYEYLRSYALLTPRPRFYHARLDLSRYSPPHLLTPEEEWTLQNVSDADFQQLKELFVGAFSRQQPFASVDRDTLTQAAHQCLEKTRTGGDGPWVRAASWAARDCNNNELLGAILITLMPEGDPYDNESYYWRKEPPADFVESGRGRPHLTWIFVHSWKRREGIASFLLRAAGEVLKKSGYTELFSTFLLGNEASLMWHWRNGFEPLAYPFSMSRLKKSLPKTGD